MALGFSAFGLRKWSCVLAFVFVGAFGSSVSAQLPDIIVRVNDTTASPGEQNSAITVTLENFFDEICGFELWIQLDRPDIMEFQTNLDTLIDTTYWDCLAGIFPNCTDSAALPPDSSMFADFIHVDTVTRFVGNFDTTGTLISGWELVSSSSVSGTPFDVRVVGTADLLGGPITPGFPPQQGGVLFRLLGDVFNIPDTATDRTVNIVPQSFLEFFNFSRCDGSSIGIIPQEILDTNLFLCLQWAPDSTTCLAWTQVFAPPFDSMEVVLDTIPILDTNKVKLNAGTLTVLSGVCGNLDCDQNNTVDIADLTVLIDHLFISFTPLCSAVGLANIDCDPNNTIDIADLTVLIDHLFINFTPLCCQQ